MISSGYWLLFLMDGISLEKVNENHNLMIILLTGPCHFMFFTLLLAIAYHLQIYSGLKTVFCSFLKILL